MSRKLWLVLILAVSTVATFWYGARPQAITPAAPSASVKSGAVPIPSPQAPAASPPAAALAPAKSQPQTPGSAPAADAAKSPGTAANTGPGTPQAFRPKPDQETPAKIEADAVALNIRHYSQRFGGNPVGSNAEIVKEMTGGNSAGATYLPADLQRLNDQGELIDSWGTPYFFHQNSADYMEVRSAGPDKKLWTIDDVISR